MAWYWYALISGLALPWLVMFKTIKAGFEAGVQQGLGAWLGISTLTVPIMFLIMWFVR